MLEKHENGLTMWEADYMYWRLAVSITECIRMGGNEKMKKVYIFFAVIIGLYIIMFAAQ